MSKEAIHPEQNQQALNNSEALHELGLVHIQNKAFSKAIEYFKQAIEHAPTVAAFHNNLANAYKRINQFNLAKTHYFEALRLKSPYPEVHNNLGGLYYQTGNINEAILQFEKSLRMQVAQPETHKNLANCYMQENRLIEAIAHFKKALEHRADDLNIIHNLGMALAILKRYDEAYPLLMQVLERDAHNIEILYQVAIIKSSIGKLEDSKQYYLKILALKNDHSDAYHNLATLYLHQQNKDKALSYYRQALHFNPENITAQHMINALSGISSQKGAPPGYVAALFDQYAYNYNQHMVEQLNYNVPLLLRESIAPYANILFNTLDLGCGTGLCAPYFRDIADKLIGIDISKNMLSLAAQQGGYDRLIETEIQDYLSRSENYAKWDLIIAADVFVYFADLTPLLKHCYQALKSSGFLVCSVEIIESIERDQNLNLNNNKIDYELKSSGRYRHHPSFIEKVATDLGFCIKMQKKAILRQENEQPVWGMVFNLEKH